MSNLHKYTNKAVDLLLSTKNLNILIFFVTLIVLTTLLSSRYYMFQTVAENGISKIDIYATKTIQVEDKEKTEKKKIEAAQNVEPILRPDKDVERVNDSIVKSLGELLNSVKTTRESSNNIVQKKKELKEILGVNDGDYFNNIILNYLLKSSDSSFQRIANESNSALEEILKKGVSEKDLTDNIDSIIRQDVGRNVSRTQYSTISILLKRVLASNMIIDEVATEIVRKNEMNSVAPSVVTFKKGDLIVKSGDLMMRSQKEALKQLGYNVSRIDFIGIVGIFAITALCLYIISYYLRTFNEKFVTPPYLSLISLLIISLTAFAVFLPTGIPVYIIPVPAIAILITVFTTSGIAILTTILTVILISVALRYNIDATTVFLIGAMVATFASSKINYSRRIDLVRAGLDVGLIQVLIILSIYLLESSFGDISFKSVIIDSSLGFTSGLIGGIISLGTLPLIEGAFKIITPYGLAELADHNQKLLKRLQFEAPGTYHHCLMVSNLCETAAESVNANPILAKVGALYHDIGKLKRPLFFVENQSYFGIENPHDNLNPRLSKMVITAHPKDGLELAKEYRLPTAIHQFITQHHGNSLASYFYRQALEMEGAENINEEQFRYTGQKPASKETAILMICDAVESAVRSLKNPTPEEIEEMIDKIIKERLLDNQLEESALTQKDLKTIAQTLNRTLRGMQHHRIKYHENMLEELKNKTNTMSQAALLVQQQFLNSIDKEK
ncbi:MAG: HDIG domain-containing metalloprotein [bacterium]